MKKKNRTLLKIMIGILVTAFSLECAVFSTSPVSSVRYPVHSLQVQSFFLYDQPENRLRTTLLLLTETIPEIQKCRLHLVQKISEGIVEIDFRQKHREGTDLIVPCYFIKGSSRKLYNAVLDLESGSVTFRKTNIPLPREEGIKTGKGKLSAVDLRADDYYFMLGDVDRLNNRNRIYSKALIGAIGEPQDPDVIFSKRSVFADILSTLTKLCSTHGLDVYRYLAGDEFVTQSDLSDTSQLQRKLELIKDAFREHFEDRYGVGKVNALTPEEQHTLASNEDVLAVVKNGYGYHILLLRNKRTSVKDQIQALNRQIGHDLILHEVNDSVIPPFTISIGGISGRALVRKLESIDGAKRLDENGRLKAEYIDEVYTWGMRIANDMLQIAKVDRDTVYVSDHIDPKDLKKPIKLEKEEAIEDGIDRLTGFYTEGRFRKEARGNLLLIEVVTYNGKYSREEGGFHAVNSVLGYDEANEVIATIARELKHAIECAGIDSAIFCRRPPDQFMVSMAEEKSLTLLEKLLSTVKKNVESALKEKYGQRFVFNMRFRLSAASSYEIEHSSISEFKNSFRVISTISQLEKAVDMISSGPIKDAVRQRKIDGVGEVRAYNFDKEKLLQLYYRLIKQREKKEAIRAAGLSEARSAGDGHEQLEPAAEIGAVLEKLDIHDELDGVRIFGTDIKKWAKEHYLFLEDPPYYDEYAEREYSLFMDIKRKRYHSLKEVEQFILGYARSIGEEERTKKWVDSLKKAARKYKQKQLDYLTGRKGPHAASRTSSPLAWAAKGHFFKQTHQMRAGKLFTNIDLTDMRLIDLPIWPVDEEGNVLEDLLKWMTQKNKAPPFEYYAARKVSIKEFMPKVSRKPVQLELFQEMIKGPEEEATPEEQIRFLRDLRQPGDLSDNAIELLFSAAISGKKLVLVFDRDISMFQNRYPLSVIRQLRDLKEDPVFEKLLKNIEIVEVPTERIYEKVQTYSAEPKTEIFIFARAAERAKLNNLSRKERLSFFYIDESEFAMNAYYPLLEIVTIALAQHLFSLDYVLKDMKRSDTKLEQLNIASIKTISHHTFIFSLIPNAKEYDKNELLNRYIGLKRLLKSA